MLSNNDDAGPFPDAVPVNQAAATRRGVVRAEGERRRQVLAGDHLAGGIPLAVLTTCAVLFMARLWRQLATVSDPTRQYHNQWRTVFRYLSILIDSNSVLRTG